MLGPVPTKELSELRDICTCDLPCNSSVDLTVPMGDEIPEAFNLAPRVIRKCVYYIIG